MKMITTALIFAATASVVIPSVSHAFGRQLANCTSRDGRYQVLVIENDGIGPTRNSTVGAQILDQDGNTLAQFAAEKYEGFASVSFGRATYQDMATKGQEFKLEGPSTNLRRYDFSALIGDKIVTENGLSCAIFGGTAL